MYTILIKSKQMSDVVLIDCSDYRYSQDVENNQFLKLYNVFSVFYRAKNVTELCGINDGILTICNMDEIETDILLG